MQNPSSEPTEPVAPAPHPLGRGEPLPVDPTPGRIVPRRFAFIWLATVTAAAVAWVGSGNSGLLGAHPGPVFPVTVTGYQTGESTDGSLDASSDGSSGKFLFTTVEYRSINRAGALLALITGRELVGTFSGGASSTLAMAGSKQMAVAVAVARVAGTDVPVEARVVAVEPGSTAERFGIIPGDVLAAVDRTAVGDGETAVTELTEPVARTLTIVRDGERLLIDIPGVRPLGIGVVTVPLATLPDVTITSSEVGGSSAGLMFTLAVIDVLTPGDLTAGMRVAGTGTIRPNGTVGVVNGAELKYQGARDARAEVFFAPRSTAPAGDDRVRVVGVETLDDALVWLCANGSAPACTLTQPADGGAPGKSLNRSSGLPAADAPGRKERQ